MYIQNFLLGDTGTASTGIFADGTDDGSSEKASVFNFVAEDGLIPCAQRRSSVFSSRFFASLRMTGKGALNDREGGSE